MRSFLLALTVALLLFGQSAAPALMAQTTVFTAANFALPAAPPMYFVPNANGSAVPAGHSSWLLSFNTTGLPAGQVLAELWVQYHFTNAQLGATGQPNQGQVHNSDGTVTQIVGGLFTGWLDDCGAVGANGALTTSHTNKLGATVFNAYLGCDLNRLIGYYPDAARFLVTSSPGYASVPSVTLTLN